MLDQLTLQLAASQALSAEQVRAAVEALVNEAVAVPMKADFLAALARKGETIQEITAFVAALREKSVVPPLDTVWRDGREILDVCGTGGDQLGTFNISTTVAFVCAAAGIAVAKHGNRAITSRAGSADVLEALGVRIDLSPADAAQSLRERNFAFFFAPNFHPAFKHIAPARKLCAERGQRTIFNFLGPLLNPVRPTAQLIGVPKPELCEPLARVLQALGVRRGMVVCGSVLRVASGLMQARTPDSAFDASETNRDHSSNTQDGATHLDELSTLGETAIAEFYQERGFAASTFAITQLRLQPATLTDLRGGDRTVNAEILRRILRGEERGPKLDAVLLNAGAALFVAGRTRSLLDGWDAALEVIESGRAFAKLQELATS